MNAYEWIKLMHILSATILFGTGLGIAYFMLRGHLSGNHEAMAVVVRSVVVADWVFTTPAVVVQLLTGLWLTNQLGISHESVWFFSVIFLFSFVGVCWVPVVWIQIRIRRIIADGGDRDDYRRLFSIWMFLGILAFTGVLLIFLLMVSKAGIDRPFFV